MKLWSCSASARIQWIARRDDHDVWPLLAGPRLGFQAARWIYSGPFQMDGASRCKDAFGANECHVPRAGLRLCETSRCPVLPLRAVDRPEQGAEMDLDRDPTKITQQRLHVWECLSEHTAAGVEATLRGVQELSCHLPHTVNRHTWPHPYAEHLREAI